MEKHGSAEKNICLHGIGILPNQVNENIVIAPWWQPSVLQKLGKAEYLSESSGAFSSLKAAEKRLFGKDGYNIKRPRSCNASWPLCTDWLITLITD